MTLKIVHFMRCRRENVFSIERMYEDIRSSLPASYKATEWVCRHPSTGIWRRLIDAWSARSAQGDVNHVTGDTHYLTYFLDSRRTILTIHDLITIQRPNGIMRLLYWFFWFWLPVRRSSKVITVSEATRNALLKSVRCKPNKVVVIHNPISKEFKPYKKDFNSTHPRILQIGTTPNKNLHRLIEALTHLQCKLVIVGPIDSKLKATIINNCIDFENHVGLSREALLNEYIKSDILMFASTYEGFGLPIVEANAVGRPVVTSNLAPMCEVAADAACLVDPYDSASIRRGVNQIINDYNYRMNLIDAGYRNAQRFDANKIALAYAQEYHVVAQATKSQ